MIYHYGTPVERYVVNGVDIRVKREDLVCVFPGAPPVGKLRAMDWIIRGRSEERIFVVDRSVHSRASWIAAFVAKHTYGAQRVTAFVPHIGYNQTQALTLGAEIIVAPSSVADDPDAIYRWAEEQHARSPRPGEYLFPDNCHLRELIRDYRQEVHRTGYRNLDVSSVVIPVGSGGLAIGVIQGFQDLRLSPRFFLHMGGSRRSRDYIADLVATEVLEADVTLVGYAEEEKTEVVGIDIPFPAHPIYEARAWRWLTNQLRSDVVHIPTMRGVLFWNAGA